MNCTLTSNFRKARILSGENCNEHTQLLLAMVLPEVGVGITARCDYSVCSRPTCDGGFFYA